MASNKYKAPLSWQQRAYNPEALKRKSAKELKDEYTRLRDIASKRIKRLGESEFSSSQTYLYYKDRNYPLKELRSDYQLRHALSDLARFLSTDLSTVKGQRRTRKQRIESLNNAGYDFIDEENFNDFTEFMDSNIAQVIGSPTEEELETFLTARQKGISTADLEKDFDYWVEHRKTLEKVIKESKGTKAKWDSRTAKSLITKYEKKHGKQ